MLDVDLQAMFQARVPLKYFSPETSNGHPNYSGIVNLVELFEKEVPQPRPYFESPQEKRKKLHESQEKNHLEKLELLAADWDPHANSKATG